MPRVTAPSARIIFCEGRPGSLDDLLLANLVTTGQVQIVPVGGKNSIRAFIDGYLGTYPGTQPNYLGFCDRDFDIEPPDSPQLIRIHGTKPIWFSYRASVENYLIDADLIWRYWHERENTPMWAYGPAPSISEIEGHIRQSASELIDYQAVGWGLARLKPGSRWPEIRTTWTSNGSGHLPSSLIYEDCLAEASQSVNSFQEQVKDIHPNRLQDYANRYLEQFNDKSFLEEQGYLLWFHGKDHLAQLCRHLSENFPRRHYANWAAEHINTDRHPDLQQLVNFVRGTPL